MNLIRKPVYAGNFSVGRCGFGVLGVVIHINEGSAAGTDAWFQNPAAGVSAHYLVCKAPEIHQYVDEGDTAFHAGIVINPTWPGAITRAVKPNLQTVGIEHEGVYTEDITEGQYERSAELIAGIAERWRFKIEANLSVVPH